LIAHQSRSRGLRDLRPTPETLAKAHEAKRIARRALAADAEHDTRAA
jgi:hypothetical protein